MDPSTQSDEPTRESHRQAEAPRRSPKRRAAEGIVLRHSRRCESRLDGTCSCKPTYQAQAWSARDRKPLRRTFATLAEARAWRQEAQVKLRRGKMNAPTRTLVREAAEGWLDAARAGVVRTRSGEPYKPSAIRSYEAALRKHLLPELGHLRLSALTRNRVQELADRLVVRGRAPSTVRNTILPLRAIYRRATEREQLAHNPTLGLALPADRRRRDHVARPAEAEALLRALPERHRALWATALYAGLRRGELQALRWSAIDLEAGILSVEHAWDRVAGLIEPKSRTGERRVPIPRALHRHLLSHRLRQRAGGEGFVFSRDGSRPFDPPSALRSARRAWARAGLSPLGFHACRHTYAAFMIAAGVNAKALSSYMGHSSITVTLDRYGHLLPGNEAEAARLLDTFLEREGRRPGRGGSASADRGREVRAIGGSAARAARG
jgi:integrase